MDFCLYTDGACQPNPGNGGWAFIAYPEEHPEDQVSQSGYQENTTNNRMEMTAVVKGLAYLFTWQGCSSEQLNTPLRITLCADSKYLLNGVETWMHKWTKNGWKRKDGKPVQNVDLWKEIYFRYELIVKCTHVLGHTGHIENEECDRLAVEEIEKHK